MSEYDNGFDRAQAEYDRAEPPTGDEPRSFEEMSDSPEETGLCDYCPLPDGAKGTHLYPSGHYSCEGSRCIEAYERYLEESEDDK
jgi:hypothetical protein